MNESLKTEEIISDIPDNPETLETLLRLQAELVKMQHWIRETNHRLAILFEGRDSAGKSGAITRFTRHLNPKHYRNVALPKPSNVEQGQWFFQRYIKELPIERYYRDAILLQVGEGTNDIQRIVIARRLVEKYPAE